MLPRHAAVVLAFAVCPVVGGCQGHTTDGSDCVSRYEVLATAPTWKTLRTELLRYREPGRVVSIRTVDRGADVGVGSRDAERIVDLLNRRGRLLAQAEVWRTEANMWRAGVWMQCIA